MKKHTVNSDYYFYFRQIGENDGRIISGERPLEEY
jgi:hypothetical protein